MARRKPNGPRHSVTEKDGPTGPSFFASAPVIGHRGAARLAPENTLAGLRMAAALGANCVEFDVRLTKDGVPVLFHDDTMDRTTDGRGRLASLT
jgi:glycerophosphoryl diester phosphodiesterase